MYKQYKNLGVVISGEGCMVSNCGYSFLAKQLFYLVFRGGTENWLPGSAVMVSSWQMLRGGGVPFFDTLLPRYNKMCVARLGHNI